MNKSHPFLFPWLVALHQFNGCLNSQERARPYFKQLSSMQCTQSGRHLKWRLCPKYELAPLTHITMRALVLGITARLWWKGGEMKYGMEYGCPVSSTGRCCQNNNNTVPSPSKVTGPSLSSNSKYHRPLTLQ